MVILCVPPGASVFLLSSFVCPRLGPPGVVTGKGFTATHKSGRQEAGHLKHLIPVQLYLCPSVPADMERSDLEKMCLPKPPICKPSSMDQTDLLRCISTAARLPLVKLMN